MDQGSNMIDLSIFFLGDMKLVYGQTKNLFWKSKVEDNAYFILKNKKNLNSFVHVSSTEWKNLFSLEIYGKKGKLEISGLGGSYGRETLTFYKMLPKMGPPKSKVWRFQLNDKSWLLEMKNFYKDISKNKTPSSNLEQSYKILKLIENIYKR
jgi:predicted dehydrogenase